MDLVWRILPVALVASRVETDRPVDSRMPSDQVPALLITLAEQLLSFGGEQIVFSFEALDLQTLLAKGRWMAATDVELRLGMPNACHQNCAQLWQQLRTTSHIATGFAVTISEGVWRRHSWLVHRDGHILETTAKRDGYYGLMLDTVQAERFVAEYQVQQIALRELNKTSGAKDADPKTC
jgi:hypothetical protein